MNIKKSLSIALLTAVAATASAQEEAKTEYVFNPHAYIQAQVGGQYTLGEIGFGKLLSPNAQIGVGYNFHKVVGARFSVNAWQSRGGSCINGETYKWKYNYVAPMIDVTFNLSNLIAGVNPNRLVDVSVFVGGGVNIAFNNDQANAANAAILANNPIITDTYGQSQCLRNLWDGTKVLGVARAGVAVDFKVADKWTVGAEIQANGISDKYNSKKADNVDWYFNGLVGVKYTFGKTHTSKKVEPTIVYRDRVVEKIVEKPVEVVKKEVATTEPLRMDVFFNLAGSKLLASEAQKVGEVAEYMKKYPNSKVTITGLADKGTGTDAVNVPLSQKRAQIVKDMLVKKYGIAESRITAVGKGSSEQPYTIPELNRVSICVAQ